MLKSEFISKSPRQGTDKSSVKENGTLQTPDPHLPILTERKTQDLPNRSVASEQRSATSASMDVSDSFVIAGSYSIKVQNPQAVSSLQDGAPDESGEELRGNLPTSSQ